MGTEIDSIRFEADAWPQFLKRLEEETALLRRKVHDGAHSDRSAVGGFEIEAWLCDTDMNPAPRNTEFLDRFGSDLATMELAKFNFELNNTPHPLTGDAFAKFAAQMHEICRRANETAAEMGLRTVTVGILPTLKPSDFCLQNMSEMKRYRALNEQIFNERAGRPLLLDIAADYDRLRLRHDSVMLEAAATSFQVHTQVPFERAHHYYNASVLASAATVAVSANAPFVFGKRLWHESRIPLFEQAVDSGEKRARVSFGNAFVRENILECFEENLDGYDILLPILFEDAAPDTFAHLRLHNGTVWRWNRPLVGFDEDGTLHFRIEHRVMSAGPSLTDMLANAAFYYGVATALMQRLEDGTPPCRFEEARHNFYASARHGLGAEVVWEGRMQPVRRLILETLLPMARNGLEALGIAASEIDRHLAIIETRTASGRNGAAWQLAYADACGADMTKLAEAYWRNQQTGAPVHTWENR